MASFCHIWVSFRLVSSIYYGIVSSYIGYGFVWFYIIGILYKFRLYYGFIWFRMVSSIYYGFVWFCLYGFYLYHGFDWRCRFGFVLVFPYRCDPGPGRAYF